MLLGEFNHSIDEKGRLIIPAKLRDDLGDSFVICNGLEGCLFVYSQEEWNKFVAELETLPRMNKDARIFKRYFFGSASEGRSEEHTSELQSRFDLVCRLLLEKTKRVII